MKVSALVPIALLLGLPCLHNPFFEALLDGGKVVPPTESAGSAFVLWSWNDEEQRTGLYVTYADLSGEVTGMYVAKGNDSENGPILEVIAESYFPTGSNFAPEYRTEELEPLMADSCYVVITTSAYPDGEVRGRLIANHAPAARRASWGSIRASYSGER